MASSQSSLTKWSSPTLLLCSLPSALARTSVPTQHCVTGGSGATQDMLTWTYTGTPIANAKLPIVFQTESLQSTAVGNSVIIPINVPAAGTYDIRVGSKNTSGRGVMQLSVNGTNVGPTADEYSSVGYTWGEFDLGSVSLSAGSQPFTFTVAGKDAASSSYQLTFDYITLIPQ
jgi:hypothetical protein